MDELTERDYINLPRLLAIFRRFDEKYKTPLVKVFLLQAKHEGGYTLADRLVEDSYCNGLIKTLIYVELSETQAMWHALDIITIILKLNSNEQFSSSTEETNDNAQN